MENANGLILDLVQTSAIKPQDNLKKVLVEGETDSCLKVSLSFCLLRYYVRKNQSLRVVLSYMFLNKTIFFEWGCTNSLEGHQIILKFVDSLQITH